MPDAPRRWCLLIHALPTRPLYLRARVRRMLAEAGAAPLRNAVYVQPWSETARRRLAAIAADIQSAGASAFVCEARFPDPATEADVANACRAELDARWRDWLRDAAARAGGSASAPGRRPPLARLRSRFEQLRARDPEADVPAEAGPLLARLEGRTVPARRDAARASLVGLRWVTRRGLHVDRLACAWVVRRWIDPTARFRFTDRPDRPLAPGEIGFDMPGAAIGHEAGRCSVETLIRRAALDDPAVDRIAEIVHDIDLADARYDHPETPGFAQLVAGVLASHPDDDQRLARGLELFDALYAGRARTRPVPSVRVPPTLRRRGR